MITAIYTTCHTCHAWSSLCACKRCAGAEARCEVGRGAPTDLAARQTAGRAPSPPPHTHMCKCVHILASVQRRWREAHAWRSATPVQPTSPTHCTCTLEQWFNTHALPASAPNCSCAASPCVAGMPPIAHRYMSRHTRQPLEKLCAPEHGAGYIPCTCTLWPRCDDHG